MGGFGGLFEPHLTSFETRRPSKLRLRSLHRHVCIAHVPCDPERGMRIQRGKGCDWKQSDQGLPAKRKNGGKPIRSLHVAGNHTSQERSPNGKYVAMRLINHQRPQAFSIAKTSLPLERTWISDATQIVDEAVATGTALPNSTRWHTCVKTAFSYVLLLCWRLVFTLLGLTANALASH